MLESDFDSATSKRYSAKFEDSPVFHCDLEWPLLAEWSGLSKLGHSVKSQCPVMAVSRHS
jgi:hypothetical protein